MRLVTRGNLDGLTSAVLITECEPIQSMELIHPQDITDKQFEVQPGDILANLPYHPNCAKWFDHHASTKTYDQPPTHFEGKYAVEASTARLVYDYYREKNSAIDRFQELVDETNRFDGANLSAEDVTDPKGFILLGFTMDPRSGLGPFKEYFIKLVDLLKQHPIEEILRHQVVKQRVEHIARDRDAFLESMKKYSRQVGKVVVTDLREAQDVPAGNRFLIYTLFPEANVSLRVAWGPQKKFVAATVGHSIFNRTCTVHVGELMSKYGGGGHKGAGATPLEPEKADQLIEAMIEDLQGVAASATS